MSDIVAQTVPFMYPYKVGTPAKMLFDKPRNRFYDTLLMQCKDKICADIGFGTGILTAIAIHHGAKHVYAYEEDPTTFRMGKEMIESMGLKNKVTCIHGKYTPGKHNEEIAFHEIVDRNLWGEGIVTMLKLMGDHNIRLLPERLYCKLHYMHAQKSHIKPKDAISETGLPYLEKKYIGALRKAITSKKFTSYDDLDKDELYSDAQVSGYMVELNKFDKKSPRYIKEKIVGAIPQNTIVWCEFFLGEFRILDGCWRAEKVVHCHEKGFYTFVTDTKDGSWWLE